MQPSKGHIYDENSMKTFLQQFIDYIHDLPEFYKALVLIVSVTLEYIFPPFPGDSIVLIAGFLNAHGAVDFTVAGISVILGSAFGAALGYKLGQVLFKPPYRYQWIRSIAESKGFVLFNRWYKKWGFWVLLFNRFLHGVRALFFIAAGAFGLPFYKTIFLNIISTIMFNGSLFGLGYWLGYNTDRILAFFYGFSTIAVFLVALLVGVLYLLIRKN